METDISKSKMIGVSIAMVLFLTSLLIGGITKVLLVDDLMLDVGYGILLASILSGMLAALCILFGAVMMLGAIALMAAPFLHSRYENAFKVCGLMAAFTSFFGIHFALIPFPVTLDMKYGVVFIALGIVLQIVIGLYGRKPSPSDHEIVC